MSSLEIIMDTGASESWVELHSRKMGRKGRWEVGNEREASELEPSDLDTTTEAIEPGEELEWGKPAPNSTDKGDFIPQVHSFPSYPPEYSTTDEHPIMINQAVGTEERKETETNIGDKSPGDLLHIPGESHASDGPSPVGGEARQRN